MIARASSSKARRDFIPAPQAAEREHVSLRRVQQLAASGAIHGAERFGRTWMIPIAWRFKATKRGPKS